ncbi:hypothetical protein D3C81_2306270 [compost metagenome]
MQTYIHTSADQLKREALEKWHGWLDGKGFAVIHGSTITGNGNSHIAVETSNGAACEANAESVKSEDSK